MGASTFAIHYAERKLSMAEPRAKRLDTARADGQDRYHEARQAAGARARRKTGLKAAINPASRRHPKAHRGFWGFAGCLIPGWIV